MSFAVREDDHILIRTGEQTWKEVDDEMARQYVHDIADALARSGGKPQTLRGYRKEQGITQQELAEMTGLSRTYLSEIERGAAQNVSLHVARKIAAVMDCPLSAIQIPQQAD